MDDLSAHMTKEEAEQYERFFEQVVYYLGNCSVVEKLLGRINLGEGKTWYLPLFGSVYLDPATGRIRVKSALENNSFETQKKMAKVITNS